MTFGVVSGLFFLVWTLHMQLGLGWGPLHAGLTGVPFSLACSLAAGVSVQKLVPRFGRKVLQAGALIMLCGALVYLGEAGRYGTALQSWQLVPAMLLMGAGMGLIVAPITDAALSEVPAEHSGSASGIFNTTGQLGMALGLGLSSVAFFGVLGSRGGGRCRGAGRPAGRLRRGHRPRPVVDQRRPGRRLRPAVPAAADGACAAARRAGGAGGVGGGQAGGAAAGPGPLTAGNRASPPRPAA